MKNTLETRLGLFVALAALAAVFILEIVGGPERFHGGVRINAYFESAQELKAGDRVKMAGVEIGRVESITLSQTNNKVCVTLKLKPNCVVHSDSTALIKFAGLMGQNYVALDFGSPNSTVLKEGDAVLTAEQPDFSSMMRKIDNVATGVENLTKSFTGDKIDNLLGPFTDFLKANREPLTKSIANIESVTSQIAHGQGTVGKLIYEDSLHNSALVTLSNVTDTVDEIKRTVADAHRVVDDINAGQGTIGKLVKDEKLYNETSEAVTNLKEILQKINRGQGSVGKLINDDEMLKNAKLTLQKLDKMTEGLEDEGPLSVMGMMMQNLL
jgi:phospholipid/cholesterol/gamma-HCH transport system substrate-binding protein